MVLKLALLASHMAKTLIENLQKTSECDVILVNKDPPTRLTLRVALLNLCYVFHIVFIK